VRVLCASSVRVGVCGVCVCSGDLELKERKKKKKRKKKTAVSDHTNLGARVRDRATMMMTDRPATGFGPATGTPSAIGPGTYPPRLRSPGGACQHQFRSTTSRHDSLAWRLPGPGAYDVPSPMGRGGPACTSSFRGASRTFGHIIASTPGPGSCTLPSTLVVAPAGAKAEPLGYGFEWRRRNTVPAVPYHREQTDGIGPGAYSPQRASQER